MMWSLHGDDNFLVYISHFHLQCALKMLSSLTDVLNATTVDDMQRNYVTGQNVDVRSQRPGERVEGVSVDMCKDSGSRDRLWSTLGHWGDDVEKVQRLKATIF
jgi:hypothetical protein